ncbi:uncharacterized protein LOC113231397 [Hyposmocoma kahamanoa]|uniref:uncharacterized protein LOC113231397 n=1 Tax=Hyposmocoma kahamanoa TaxID=1477025 RepID=UPI000E6D883D|nr:uncharacterized protein LOC113231397 [Hyposmocoma kahamanoa]
MKVYGWLFTFAYWLYCVDTRDEDKIMKACYWPNEMYEPCFGGCAEVSCDNPRNHLRPCYPYCEPGCVCEEPYVRDDRTHQCVLPQDCSPTQMGIPVPSKKKSKLPSPPPVMPPGSSLPYDSRMLHYKRSEGGEIMENELSLSPQHPEEQFKRGNSDMSRMGNYFNIVIAPPPIKTLQPRKMISNDYRVAPKRYSS